MAPARVASVEDVKDVTRRVGGGDSTDSDAVATYVLWPRGLANAGDASLPAASGVLLGWCLPACLANGRASAVVVAAVVPADDVAAAAAELRGLVLTPAVVGSWGSSSQSAAAAAAVAAAPAVPGCGGVHVLAWRRQQPAGVGGDLAVRMCRVGAAAAGADSGSTARLAFFDATTLGRKWACSVEHSPAQPGMQQLCQLLHEADTLASLLRRRRQRQRWCGVCGRRRNRSGRSDDRSDGSSNCIPGQRRTAPCGWCWWWLGVFLLSLRLVADAALYVLCDVLQSPQWCPAPFRLGVLSQLAFHVELRLRTLVQLPFVTARAHTAALPAAATSWRPQPPPPPESTATEAAAETAAAERRSPQWLAAELKQLYRRRLLQDRAVAARRQVLFDCALGALACASLAVCCHGAMFQGVADAARVWTPGGGSSGTAVDLAAVPQPVGSGTGPGGGSLIYGAVAADGADSYSSAAELSQAGVVGNVLSPPLVANYSCRCCAGARVSAWVAGLAGATIEPALAVFRKATAATLVGGAPQGVKLNLPLARRLGALLTTGCDGYVQHYVRGLPAALRWLEGGRGATRSSSGGSSRQGAPAQEAQPRGAGAPSSTGTHTTRPTAADAHSPRAAGLGPALLLCCGGLSFGLALLADVWALLVLPVRALHWLSAAVLRGYGSILLTLLRLFVGRKANVLKDRVDHTDLQPLQLLLGTIVFVSMVFLAATLVVHAALLAALWASAWLQVAALRRGATLLRQWPCSFHAAYAAAAPVAPADSTTAPGSAATTDASSNARADCGRTGTGQRDRTCGGAGACDDTANGTDDADRAASNSPHSGSAASAATGAEDAHGPAPCPPPAPAPPHYTVRWSAAAVPCVTVTTRPYASYLLQWLLRGGSGAAGGCCSGAAATAAAAAAWASAAECEAMAAAAPSSFEFFDLMVLGARAESRAATAAAH